MLNPDVWHTVFGGEKTMEFGFLNATLRSPWMPPADPFFAGGYINYYYHGQFIIACLIKLIGIDPAIAFNLGLAIIFALTFLAAASIVYNVVAWSRARRGSLYEVSRVGMTFALLGGILMMVIGNLSTIVQYVWVIFPGTANTLMEWGRNLGFTTEGLAWGARPEFYFWPPSRVITNTINEFPYWSFLYGDLHPHLIDMPFTLMAAAIGVNLALAGRYMLSGVGTGVSRFADLRVRVVSALQWLWGRGGAGVLSFGFTALSLGGLFVTNSWDFPTYAGLLGGAVFIALLLSRKASPTDVDGRILDAPKVDRPLGFRGGLTLTITAFVAVGAVAGLAVLAYLPFFLNFKAFFTRLMPLVDGGLIPGTGTIMHRTTIWEFLGVWGIFLFIALSYLGARLWNFPWRAALADLLGLVPIGRDAAGQPNLSPASPIMYEPEGRRPPGLFFPMRKARRFELALAFSGGSGPANGSSDMYFRAADQTGDDLREAQGADSEATEGDGSVPVETVSEVDEVSLSRTSNSDESAGSSYDAILALVGDREGGGIQDIVRVDDAIDAVGENGRSREVEVVPAPAVNNWVAEAHHEVRRQRVAPVGAASYQPGVIPLWAGFAILAASAALTALQVATGQQVLALLVALIGGLIGTLLSTTRSGAALAGGLLLVVGLIVTLGVEVVYLSDHLAGGDLYRMNTVFKFYVQAWGLIAIGGAIAVYYILYGVRDRTEPEPDVERERVDESPSPDEYDDFDSLHLADHDADRSVHPNGAVESNSHEASRVTVPLPGTHPTTNWLVWSTEDIAGTSIPTTEPADSEATSADGTPTAPLEESIPSLVTRPLQTRSDAQMQEEAREVEYLEEPIPEPVEQALGLLNIRWTASRIVWAAFAILFLLVGFIFPIYGTPSKLKERIQPDTPIGTLSGLSYMQNAVYSTDQAPFPIEMKYDYEGINWLNAHVNGLATIAELPAEYYRAGGMRVASNTGLPMVIGGLHQDEQRADVYARLVGDRQRDVNELYTTPDIQTALTIISKYDIDYIYLGQLEQGYVMQQEQTNHISAQAAIGKFAQMADPEIGILKRVCCDDPPGGVVGTIIYQVTREKDKDPKTLVGSPVEGSGLPGISITPLPTSTPVPPPTPPVDDPQLKALINDVTADPNNRDKRVKLVEWYRDNGYPLEAAKQLEILVQQNPADVALRHQLGDMYNAAGMPDEALKAWEDARDVAPNNPDAHNKVGIAYLERKRYDEALHEFQEAVQVDPSYVEAWYHMGEVYERKGDRDGAKSAYQSVIDNSREPNGWKDDAQKRLDALK